MSYQPDLIISHWNQRLDGLDASAVDFYTRVLEILEEHKLEKIGATQTKLKEGGVFSAKRLYLHISHGEHSFDICGAPYGNGFFVSWWLGESYGFFVRLITNTPIIRFLFGWLIQPITYYKIDTAMMFQSVIHSAVLEAVDEMTNAKGVRRLESDERKPIMRDVFGS